MNEKLAPEDIFRSITVLPKHKIQVNAWLEDEEGDKISIADIAESLNQYIDDNLASDEFNTINTQLIPLIAQFSTSLLPRAMGIQNAALLLGSSLGKNATLIGCLSTMLLFRYIDQHKLKIVTENIDLSEAQLQEYVDRSMNFDKILFGDEKPSEEDEDEPEEV